MAVLNIDSPSKKPSKISFTETEPTPAGVPVKIISPFLRVKKADIDEIISSIDHNI